MKTIFHANRKALLQCRYVTMMRDPKGRLTYSAAHYTHAQRLEYERHFREYAFVMLYRINVCPANYSPEHFRARIGK